MRIYNGAEMDTCNFSSNKFLEVNSCGFQNAENEYMVIREKGRIDYHILLMTGGVCEAVYDGECYELKAGDVMFYTPGETQKYTFSNGASSMWCHFTGTAVPEIMESSDLTGGVYRLPVDIDLCNTFSDMIRFFHHPGRKNVENVYLLKLIYSVSELKKRLNNDKESDMVSALLAYINSNYNKKISLEQMAEFVGYSKSRVSHLFMETTGLSPIRYQNNIRLENAGEMIASTSLDISEIAVCCGFGDYANFSKAFKKKYNVSPVKYRMYSRDL